MGQYAIELYETATGKEVVAKEMRKALTAAQREKVWGQLSRVEEHGRQLNYYFGTVRGSQENLGELRLNADRVDVRFLFSEEPGRILLLLACYKEQSGSIPAAVIRRAEKRLADWRARK